MDLFGIGELQHSQITNVNVRKEKHGADELVTAIDLAVKSERVPLAAVAVLFGVDPDTPVRAFYVAGGNLALLNMGLIPLDVEFENKYQVHIDRIEDRASKVSKFKVKPRGGEVFEVHYKVAISQPSDEFFAAAVDNQLQDSAMLRLEPIPDLFSESEAA